MPDRMGAMEAWWVDTDDRPAGAGVANALVVVAHPDDETLWAGGLMLCRPDVGWHVVALTRASDRDRAPRFLRALEAFGARGGIADLDDGPEQTPLPASMLERTVLDLVPPGQCDLLLTHGPAGEYTRHRRHEEVSRAVTSLWARGELAAASLWLFAYGDDGAGSLPRPDRRADVRLPLPRAVWRRKVEVMRDTYGFAPTSWEVRAALPEEAFRCFASPRALSEWLAGREPRT